MSSQYLIGKELCRIGRAVLDLVRSRHLSSVGAGGFTRSSLLVYPVVQALATGGTGCLLAFGFYGLVAFAIDMMFSDRTGGEAICTVSAAFLCLTFLCVQALSVLASLRAAIRASAIEPSAVIREL